MTEFEIDKDAPILVEFLPGQGEEPGQLEPEWEETSLKSKIEEIAEEVADKGSKLSDRAVQVTLNTIHNMAERVAATIKSISDRPNEFEVTFGLKFDAKVGARIAAMGAQASVQIKLKWKQG